MITGTTKPRISSPVTSAEAGAWRFRMSLTSVLSADAIANALKECQAPDTFCHKKFFQTCGLTKKTSQEVKNVFRIMDDDGSEFIEEDELQFFLQRFSPSARVLTESETKKFMLAVDEDKDGKIGIDEFEHAVLS